MKEDKLKKECVAFILMPAYHKGPDRILLISLIITVRQIRVTNILHTASITHHLTRFCSVYLTTISTTAQESQVKIIFVPSYLNGNDGIFNMPYFDLLIGFDLSVFPSYYEPWGYTPLESLMFSIPTVTTSLSGFGLWVKNYYADHGNGISIIERTDDNELQVIAEIQRFIKMFIGLDDAGIRESREKAHDVSRIAMWDSLVKYYYTAYDQALDASSERRGEPREFARFVEAPGIPVRKAAPGTCMESHLCSE